MNKSTYAGNFVAAHRLRNWCKAPPHQIDRYVLELDRPEFERDRMILGQIEKIPELMLFSK
jgi:hypothetical protein